MSPARFALVFLLAAGCLQPGSLPEGQKLFSGRDVGSAVFLPPGGTPWGVAFSQRKAPATPSKGAVSDLWLAPVPDNVVIAATGNPSPVPAPISQPTLVIANRSDRWSPQGAGQSILIMVDERQVTSGGAGKGQTESIGTLVRLNSQFQADLRFENISDFTAGSETRLLFRQVPEDNQTPGLFLWDNGEQRRLGDVANVSLLDIAFGLSSGMAYFILGDDRVLSRLDQLTDTVQDLHAHVSRYLLRGDEKYAALALSDAGATSTVVLDLQAGKEIQLARPNPCCWIGFLSDAFSYSQSAGPDAPAEYHTLDLASGTDTVLVLPAPLIDFAFPPLNRPNSDDVLYLDSQGHGVFFGQNDLQVRRVLPETTRMVTATFSPDGQYLLYIDPQPTTALDPTPHGPLMVQDADYAQPPRQLSTPGMKVHQGDFFFIAGPNGPILVFWAYVVRASVDLYFANHVTGELQVVAGAIGSVTVDSNRIFGTVHLSDQDAVGDLVVKDVRDNGGRTIAHAVPQSEFAQAYGVVSYVVRGRAPSDYDGLWVTTLAPPGQDGGR